MDDVAGALARELGPLRRAALRATREAAGLPDLPDAQVEVLRLLAQGPLGPSELAVRLRLARSTVSNLLRALTTAGLVERTLTTADLRAVRVTASPTALDLLARHDSASAAAVAGALAGLDPREHAALADAVPVLQRLTELLDGSRRG